METLKATIAKNIAALRTANHITQLELGEKLSYTDKAVSKWERGDSIPDVTVLKQIADMFGVTVDYLLREHDGEKDPSDIRMRQHDRKLITAISVAGIWCAAALVFVITGILGNLVWQCFVFSIPICLILLLVFNCIWGKRKYLLWILSAFIWSLLLTVYLAVPGERMWMIFLTGIPAQIIVVLGCNIGIQWFKTRKEKDN